MRRLFHFIPFHTNPFIITTLFTRYSLNIPLHAIIRLFHENLSTTDFCHFMHRIDLMHSLTVFSGLLLFIDFLVMSFVLFSYFLFKYHLRD